MPWPARERNGRAAPDAHSYLERGDALERAGKLAEACEQFAKAVEDVPRYTAAVLRSIEMGWQGIFPDKVEFTRAAAASPGSGTTAEAWGEYTTRRREYLSAVSSHDAEAARALERAPWKDNLLASVLTACGLSVSSPGGKGDSNLIGYHIAFQEAYRASQRKAASGGNDDNTPQTGKTTPK